MFDSPSYLFLKLIYSIKVFYVNGKFGTKSYNFDRPFRAYVYYINTGARRESTL